MLRLPYIKVHIVTNTLLIGGELRHYPYEPNLPSKRIDSGLRIGGDIRRALIGSVLVSGSIVRSLDIRGVLYFSGQVYSDTAYLLGGIQVGGAIQFKPQLLGSAGMTQLISSSTDDGFVDVGDIGFDFPFYNRTFRNQIYVGSNGYLTFGFGSRQYSGISPGAPGSGLFICAGDRSYQQVFVHADTPNSFRIRYEGSAGTSGTVGAPTMLWETTLLANGDIVLATGNLNESGASFITDGGTNYTNLSLQGNKSYKLTRYSSSQYTYSEF